MQFNMYTDLDSLFDTRLVLASLLDPNGTLEMLSNRSYYNRLIDNYNNVSNSIFRALYSSRTKELLRAAYPTSIMLILRDALEDLIMDPKHMVVQEGNICYVNTYPYTLNEEETKLLAGNIRVVLHKCIVRFIYRNPIDVTPSWLLEKNIKIMAKYDILPWLDYHIATGDILNNIIHDITAIGPAIIYKPDPNIKVTVETIRDYERFISMFIDLKLIPLVNFTALDEDE